MSLVDYALSDEEEDREEPQQRTQELQPQNKNAVAIEKRPNDFEAPNMDQLPAPKRCRFPPQATTSNQRFRPKINMQGAERSQQAEPPAFKLPDVSLLLNSPTVPSHLFHATNHSSRVAAAVAESELRKRKSSSFPRNEVPSGNLRYSKSIPETVGGHLLPPQLIGRSNVVTEDLSKLFAKKHAASSPQ